MQLSVTKTGKVRIKLSKFVYKHQLTLGDILTLLLLTSWFAYDIMKGVGR